MKIHAVRGKEKFNDTENRHSRIYTHKQINTYTLTLDTHTGALRTK